MFLQNKYTKWYFSIIEKARSQILTKETYLEKHHIIPKGCGGDDIPENRVRLTAKEHYLCHRLLPKMLINKTHQRNMMYALHRIVYATNSYHKGKQKYFSARHYDVARKAASQAHSKKVVSEETRKKMSLAKQNMSQETKDKIRLARTGVTMSQETKDKIRKANIGKPSPNKGKELSEEWKKKLSESTKGSKKSEEIKQKMRKPKSEETRLKMSIAAKKRGNNRKIK